MIDFNMSEIARGTKFHTSTQNKSAISAEMSEREHRSELSHVTAQMSKMLGIFEHTRKSLIYDESSIFDKLKEEQLKLAKKVVTKDSFDKIELIAGVDAAYKEDDVIAAIVVCDYKTMEVKEKVFAAVKTKVPYLKGFLAYREGHAISEAYAKLSNKPDIMLFDGNGILHPRICGLASHIGVLLDQASIGIAKQLLVGEIKGKIVYVDKEAMAESIVTRRHSKPIYVSPGHKVSLKTSVKIVKNCIRFPHKLPEPLYLAHRYANEIREKIGKGELKVKE